MAEPAWALVPLLDIAEARGLVGGPFGSKLGRKDYVSAGVPVIRGANMTKGRYVDLSDCVYVTAEKVMSDLAGNTAESSDLIVTQRGTLGQVCMMPEGAEAVVSQSQMRMRVNRTISDPLFVLYAMRCDDFQTQIRANAISAGVPHINLGLLSGFRIPLPALPVQRRIAAVLGALDDLIEANERLIDLLELQGSALLEVALLPAPYWLAGKVPDDWTLTTIEEVTTVVETGRRPRGGVSGIKSGTPSIGAESIKRLATFDYRKVKYVPDEFAEGMRQGVVESRDVLVYKDGGKPGEFRPNVSMFGDGFPFPHMTINEHVYRVRASELTSNEYLYFWLRRPELFEEMHRKGTGAAIPGLNSTAFKSLTVVLPDPATRLALERRLDALVSQALASAVEIQQLRQARDELLPLLMSGRVSPGEVDLGV